MLLIMGTPATGVGLIHSKKGFFSNQRDCLPGLDRSRTMHHIRTKHSEIKCETDFIEHEGEIALSQADQYVIIHRRGELVMMKSYAESSSETHSV